MAKSIEHAIQSYMDRTGASGGTPPYDAESLAQIYAPQVQELFELRAEGYVAAEWREGHWHGVELEPQPVRPAKLRWIEDPNTGWGDWVSADEDTVDLFDNGDGTWS